MDYCMAANGRMAAMICGMAFFGFTNNKDKGNYLVPLR